MCVGRYILQIKKIRIGKITRPHGLKGEFRVYPYTDDVQTFLDYEKVFIEGVEEPFFIEKSRLSNRIFICKLRGYDKIEDIEKFVNKFLFIDYLEKRKMEDGEYLVGDLIGLEVYEDGNLIGKVDDILSYPVSDIIKVITTEGKELMIPNIGEFVKKIDIDSQKIEVKLIKGM